MGLHHDGFSDETSAVTSWGPAINNTVNVAQQLAVPIFVSVRKMFAHRPLEKGNLIQASAYRHHRPPPEATRNVLNRRLRYVWNRRRPHLTVQKNGASLGFGQKLAANVRCSSCLILSCLVLSCLVLSCLVLSCLVLSCLVLSCLV